MAATKRFARPRSLSQARRRLLAPGTLAVALLLAALLSASLLGPVPGGAGTAHADAPPSSGDYFLRPQPSTVTLLSEGALKPLGEVPLRRTSGTVGPARPPVPAANLLLGRLLTDEVPGPREGKKPADGEPFLLHTIVEGDTSFTIAVEHDISVFTLLINNPLIVEGEVLLTGEDVVIPRGNGILHTVQTGDTLSSIAAAYEGGTAAGITGFALNDVKTDSDLVPGKKVLVVGGRPLPPPEPELEPEPESELGPVIDDGWEQSAYGLVWPVYGPLSDYFGSCRSEDCAIWHTGIDIDLYLYVGAGSHAEIYSAAAGTVVTVEHLTYGYGYYVVLAHEEGLSTLYAHLSEIWVSPGETLVQGEALGLSGSTGYSTGEHLHFEVRQDGLLGDPLDWLP